VNSSPTQRASTRLPAHVVASLREGAEAKGRRYLGEGRLTVERVDARSVRATCRGSGAAYVCGWDGTTWFCSCPARSRCAHPVALQLVTVAEEPGT
jgi:uncharacterized Zn finger protein